MDDGTFITGTTSSIRHLALEYNPEKDAIGGRADGGTRAERSHNVVEASAKIPRLPIIEFIYVSWWSRYGFAYSTTQENR
jgi:hypothetical protein